MDWLSVAIVAFLALLTWRAYVNGIIRELVAFSAIMLAIPVAGLFYDDLGARLETIFDSGNAARLVAFLALLFGVVILGQVGGQLLRRAAEVLNLGWADSFAGGVIGFAKGFLIVQAVLLALVTFPRPDVREHIDASPVATGIVEASPFALSLLPGAFNRAVDAFQDGRFDIPGFGNDEEPVETETEPPA